MNQGWRSAACSHLILRSRAKRGVSKDGDALRTSPPFETPAVGGLLRVRPKGKAAVLRNEPENHFGKRNSKPLAGVWNKEIFCNAKTPKSSTGCIHSGPCGPRIAA